MFKYVPAIESTVFIIILFALNLLLIKRLLEKFDKELEFKKNFKRAVILTLTVSFFVFLGMSTKTELLLKISVMANLFLIFGNLSILISMPFMLLYRAAFCRGDSRIVPTTEEKITRKDFIKKGVLIFPIIALTTSSIGLLEGFSSIKFPKFNFKFKNLPKSFDGLKIAHISDLHLGFFVRVNDFKKIVNSLNEKNIDLLLITGDFVDDYIILDEVMELLKTIKTKYGIYASIGNHEYFRGIKPVVKAFKKHKIPLLINENIKIKHNNEEILIGGVDDPKRITGDINKFLKNSLSRVLENTKEEDFKIIMSHRPNILPIAAKKKIELVLSGHTHGAQFGFNNRSIFEKLYPKSYLWGKYQIDNTILYTSSGAGHWFPFRIGCPTEIPIITLSKTKIE